MKVDFSRSLVTDVPGFEFGVMATASDLEGKEIDMDFAVNLVDIQEDLKSQEKLNGRKSLDRVGMRALKGKTIKSCITASGGIICRIFSAKVCFLVNRKEAQKGSDIV